MRFVSIHAASGLIAQVIERPVSVASAANRPRETTPHGRSASGAASSATMQGTPASTSRPVVTVVSGPSWSPPPACIAVATSTAARPMLSAAPGSHSGRARRPAGSGAAYAGEEAISGLAGGADTGSDLGDERGDRRQRREGQSNEQWRREVARGACDGASGAEAARADERPAYPQRRAAAGLGVLDGLLYRGALLRRGARQRIAAPARDQRVDPGRRLASARLGTRAGELRSADDRLAVGVLELVVGQVPQCVAVVLLAVRPGDAFVGDAGRRIAPAGIGDQVAVVGAGGRRGKRAPRGEREQRARDEVPRAQPGETAGTRRATLAVALPGSGGHRAPSRGFPRLADARESRRDACRAGLEVVPARGLRARGGECRPASRIARPRRRSPRPARRAGRLPVPRLRSRRPRPGLRPLPRPRPWRSRRFPGSLLR